MSPEQRLAILNAALMRAHIRAMGMCADNISRIMRGKEMAYNEEAFLNVITEEGIGYDAVMTWIHES